MDAEKIIEEAWESRASKNSAELPIPDHQKEELDKRYAAFKKGDPEFHDWKKVHSELRKRV